MTAAMQAVEVVTAQTSNASLTGVAISRDARLDELRREAVTRALTMIEHGSGPGMAAAVLIASVLGSQARTAGIRLHREGG